MNGTDLLPAVTAEQTDWEIGWKGANLLVDSDFATLKFGALGNVSVSYGVADVAHCMMWQHLNVGPRHEAPADTCHCGFNAWQDHKVAIEYFTRGNCKLSRKQRSRIRRGLPVRRFDTATLLRVGLWGTVIEGTMDIGDGWDKWGFRASHQVVGDIFLHDTCVTCSQPADRLYAHAHPVHGCATRYLVQTACDKHVYRTYIPLHFDELVTANDVRFHWGRPAE